LKKYFLSPICLKLAGVMGYNMRIKSSVYCFFVESHLLFLKNKKLEKSAHFGQHTTGTLPYHKKVPLGVKIGLESNSKGKRHLP